MACFSPGADICRAFSLVSKTFPDLEQTEFYIVIYGLKRISITINYVSKVNE